MLKKSICLSGVVAEAPFLSSHAALNFAYKHTHGDYPANKLGRSQAHGPSRGTPQPRGIEAATLAGWVRNTIEGGLTEPHRSIMLAKYAVDSPLNLTAKLVVLEAVLAIAVGTGLHKRRMVDLCVQRYFGGTIVGADGVRRPIRQHQIADCCDVSQQTVSDMNVRVKKWINTKEREALDMVENQLQQRGMIE